MCSKSLCLVSTIKTNIHSLLKIQMSQREKGGHRERLADLGCDVTWG